MLLSKKSRKVYTTMVPATARSLIERAVAGPYPRVYDKNKFIFIHIPKTAGQSICQMIGVRGARHLTYRQYYDLLGEKLENYYIFTVARNPMDRLISAWSYMSRGGNGSKEDISFKEKWVDPFMDFNEFVDHALALPQVCQLGKFRPQTDFLKPPEKTTLNTITIVKFENLREEIKKLPKNILKTDHLPHVNSSYRPIISISERTAKKVLDFYQDDFSYFGYPSDIQKIIAYSR